MRMSLSMNENYAPHSHIQGKLFTVSFHYSEKCSLDWTYNELLNSIHINRWRSKLAVTSLYRHEGCRSCSIESSLSPYLKRPVADRVCLDVLIWIHCLVCFWKQLMIIYIQVHKLIGAGMGSVIDAISDHWILPKLVLVAITLSLAFVNRSLSSHSWNILLAVPRYRSFVVHGIDENKTNSIKIFKLDRKSVV